MYKILKESKFNYHVRYSPGTLSKLYANLIIPKSQFGEWRYGKIDSTDYSKVERVQPKSTANPKMDAIKLDDKEHKIINYLMDQVLYDHYIIQSDIALKGISKAQIKRIVEDSQLLKQYGLRRIRATGAVKGQFKIEGKGNGYPYIICMVEE
ncbi:MAG: hypothetical protein GX340_00290 [Clostridiales bacterium]|nr:hypothetical protein [Clostridiales bacterium]